MNKGGFGYCTHTWNTMVGCDKKKISAGCEKCWAESMAVRQKYRATVLGDDDKWIGNVALFPGRLDDPLKAKKPAVIAVNFMGDMFCGEADFEFIERIWDTFFDSLINLQHIFLILTKRPEKMWAFCKWLGTAKFREPFYKNLWFGASASNQEDFDRIVDPMLKIAGMGANTWLSLEPLLGELDFSCKTCNGAGWYIASDNAGSPFSDEPYRAQCGDCRGTGLSAALHNIGQAIIGGESGHKPRHMKPEWAADIIRQCQAAGVPVYMKQMSGRAPIPPELNVKQLAWEMPQHDQTRLKNANSSA